MDFSHIIKQLDNINESLKDSSRFNPIEKDIIKRKLSELYLQLCHNQPDTVVEMQAIKNPEAVTSVPEEESAPSTLSSREVSWEFNQKPEKETQPSKPEAQKNLQNLDYKSLVDIFLEKGNPQNAEPKEDNTILGKLSQSKITDLKRAIAMNDRFIFIKELFNNDFESYNHHINNLNNFSDAAEAGKYLSRLQSQYRWNEEDEIVRGFISLIERKFQ